MVSKSSSWLTSALAAMLLLGGCSMNPTYERPEPPVPAAWPDDIKSVGTANAKALDWNTFFPDERLRALIRLALDNNRDLRIATARIAEARALYGIQRADRLPSLAVGVSQTAARTPADLSSSGSEVISRRFDANVGMLPFELDFWGRVTSLSQAAQSSYLATEQAQRAFRLSLVASVADAYLALAEAQERLALARASLASRGETRELVDRRRAAGLAGDLDYLQADATFEGARAEVASLQRQHSAARNFLRSLIGTEPARLPAGRPLAEQGIPLELQAGLPAQVLVRRPDILAAEQRLLAANASIGAARAAFFPRITLTASAGTASRELTGLFKEGGEAWSFAPSLSLPIFNHGRNRSGLDLAEVRKEIAVAEYERAIQQAFREVADLLAGREQLAEQLQALEAQQRSQQRAADIAEARYKQGVGSFLEVLDAQRQLFAVRQNLLQIRRALWSAAAQLYKALGGEDS